jgi:hypothetical protein
MLTITRILLAAGGTGGQNQNSKFPSGEPPPLPRTPSCSPPVSSTARTWKDGAIIGQYSPSTHGCPYSGLRLLEPMRTRADTQFAGQHPYGEALGL